MSRVLSTQGLPAQRSGNPPLMSFEEASTLVVDFLRGTIPLGFWSVTQHQDDQQVYLTVHDDAYGKVAGDSHAWRDSFCQFMVTGETPQIAPDAMSVPQYAGAEIAQALTIGAYVGVPISDGNGQLFGTICGLDPNPQSPDMQAHAPLLYLLSALLGQILRAERLHAEEAERQAELHWQAFHDSLTGLPNRALFLDRLEHAQQLHRRDLRPLGVLLLDLDDFKLVNDGLGHACGDELLIRVGERLSGVIRTGDTLARIGGDEFAVLLEDGGDSLLAAHRLVESLQQPFLIAGSMIAASVSVGVAELDAGSPVTETDALLTQADVAMYHAKRNGKARLARYEPDMTLPGSSDLTLRLPLQRAVQEGSLRVAYQPIVDLDSGVPVGYEALARWEHDGVPVPPDVFIPIAARASLLPALTDQMLDSAGAQLARWSAERGDSRLRVGVNVPPELFVDRDFPARVAACIRRHGLVPGQLVLELTEEALLTDLPSAQEVARDLIAAGASLSMDDFGVGAASLGRLCQIPLQSIKIDRSFTADLDRNPETERFVRALLALGRDLGLDVVVEGVEREEQAATLRRLGCQQAQGYLFGRPAPADRLTSAGAYSQATPSPLPSMPSDHPESPRCSGATPAARASAQSE